MALRDETDTCPVCGCFRIWSMGKVGETYVFLGMYCGTCRALTNPEGLLETEFATTDAFEGWPGRLYEPLA